MRCELHTRRTSRPARSWMLPKTSKREPFLFGWKIERPWARGGGQRPAPHTISVLFLVHEQTKPPFPTQFPITIARQCPGITSGREATIGKVEAGKSRSARGRRRVRDGPRSSEVPSSSGSNAPFYSWTPDPPRVVVTIRRISGVASALLMLPLVPSTVLLLMVHMT
jgi:hypothetical protein